MRHILAFAAAPLALLAACGDSTPVDEVEPQPMDESAVVDDTDVIAAAEGVSEDAYTGTYTLASAEGTARLTLGADDSYEYVAPDGTVRSGSYTRMEDGRLMIEEFDGRAGYFTLSEGDLYRLADAETPVNEITVEGRYTRERASAPLGSTNTVHDKRQ